MRSLPRFISSTVFFLLLTGATTASAFQLKGGDLRMSLELSGGDIHPIVVNEELIAYLKDVQPIVVNEETTAYLDEEIMAHLKDIQLQIRNDAGENFENEDFVEDLFGALNTLVSAPVGEMLASARELSLTDGGGAGGEINYVSAPEPDARVCVTFGRVTICIEIN